jgi:hypothetical protein
MKKIIEEIASKHLGIQTLETRKSDSLDFHDCAVWSIKNALEAAYQAGLNKAVQDSCCPDCGYQHPGGTCWDN